MLLQFYCKDNTIKNKIDYLMSATDKYNNKRFNSKSELILYLLRIGLYHFYEDNEIEEKPVYKK